MNAFEEQNVHAPEEDSLVLSSPDSDSEETSTDISAVENESEGDSANLSPSESGSEGASLDRSLSKNGMEEESPDFVVSEKNGPEKTTPVPPVPGKGKSPKKIVLSNLNNIFNPFLFKRIRNEYCRTGIDGVYFSKPSNHFKVSFFILWKINCCHAMITTLTHIAVINTLKLYRLSLQLTTKPTLPQGLNVRSIHHTRYSV